MRRSVESVLNCPCGRPHICTIRTVSVGDGALGDLPELCAGFHRILLVADSNTWQACGREAAALLGDSVAGCHIFRQEGLLIPDEAAIAALETALKAISAPDLILGVGSGVINDLCKYVSHRHDLPYAIVATAPSMDGYASVGAALILGGMKVTENARPPIAILGDTRVLQNAPLDMIRAGYGDIVGKYSCLNDWRLAAHLRGEYLCQTVWQSVKAEADRVAALAGEIAVRQPEAIGTLMEALVNVGIAMAYVGSSRPASGSEHHLSHFFEITGILEGTPYLPHGTDVAFSAVVTAAIREKLRRGVPRLREKALCFDREALCRVYGPIAGSVMELQQRVGFYDGPLSEAALTEKLETLREILAQAPTEAEMRRMVEAVGLSMDTFYAAYPPERIRDAIAWGKDLKDRYSVLWLNHLYDWEEA